MIFNVAKATMKGSKAVYDKELDNDPEKINELADDEEMKEENAHRNLERDAEHDALLAFANSQRYDIGQELELMRK